MKHFTPKIVAGMKVAGNRSIKTFPGLYPTRVYFKIEMRKGEDVLYIGKPSSNAYRQLRYALGHRKPGGMYFISEFDREGLLYICALDKLGKTHNKTCASWSKVHPGSYTDSSMTWMAGDLGKSEKRNGIYGKGEAF